VGSDMHKGNICLGCRFGSVKIEILVPEKYDLKDFVAQKKDFASEIIAFTGGKPIHYSILFSSNENPSKLERKIYCSCILNVNRNDCSKFNLRQEKNCKIKHLADNRSQFAQEIEIKI
jgi:hypothetical protein